MYVVDHLHPGTVIHRRVEVSSTLPTPIRVVVYTGAASIADGSFLPATQQTVTDLTRRASNEPGVLTLAPHAIARVRVTIDVPADASAGERYGVIWVQTAPSAGAGAVHRVSRVGVRVYLSIGAGGPPAAAFTIGSLSAARSSSGDPLASALVHNTGGRALDMTGTLTLTGGPVHLSAGPFPATLGTTLAPGQTEPVRIVLDRHLPRGPWTARLVLTADLLTHTAQATVTFPVAGVGRPVPTTPVPPSAPHRRLLLMAGAALLLIAGAAVAAVRGRRRPRATPRAAAPNR